MHVLQSLNHFTPNQPFHQFAIDVYYKLIRLRRRCLSQYYRANYWPVCSAVQTGTNDVWDSEYYKLFSYRKKQVQIVYIITLPVKPAGNKEDWILYCVFTNWKVWSSALWLLSRNFKIVVSYNTHKNTWKWHIMHQNKQKSWLIPVIYADSL